MQDEGQKLCSHIQGHPLTEGSTQDCSQGSLSWLSVQAPGLPDDLEDFGPLQWQNGTDWSYYGDSCLTGSESVSLPSPAPSAASAALFSLLRAL